MAEAQVCVRMWRMWQDNSCGAWSHSKSLTCLKPLVLLPPQHMSGRPGLSSRNALTCALGSAGSGISHCRQPSVLPRQEKSAVICAG